MGVEGDVQEPETMATPRTRMISGTQSGPHKSERGVGSTAGESAGLRFDSQHSDQIAARAWAAMLARNRAWHRQIPDWIEKHPDELANE